MRSLPGLFAARGSPRLSHHVARNVAEAARAAHIHRVRAERDQINTYMRTVMGEEPVDPSLEILPDEESW